MTPTPLRRSRATALAAATALLLGGALTGGAASATPGSPSPAPTPAEPSASSSVVVPGEAAPSTYAAPAQVLRQPDGTTFRATRSDSAVGGLFETLAGYSVARAADGTWVYVTGTTKGGKPVLSTAVVGADRVPAGVAPRAGRTATAVDPALEAMRDSIEQQLRAASRKAQLAAAAAGSPRVFKVPALMLATYYDEAKGETSPTFQAGHDKAYFTKILDGFGGNPNGSMTQFYYEASFGQFLVEVDVFGTYTSALSQGDPCHYGDGNGEFKLTDPAGSVLGIGGLGALGMAVEAVPQANVDPAMNWADYDNDGDGKVDFTMVIHSGGDHAATGNDCFTHSHALQATLGLGTTAENAVGLPAGTLKAGIPTSSPGVVVDRVVTIPEYASAKDPLTIGVATHEMAHAIGEPDYYDTSYASTGTGDFDIMSGGSYMGSPSGSNPTMMNPATRVFQGWVTPRVVTSSLRRYTLRPRTALPAKGYAVGEVDPNLLLVPTYEIKEGQTDKLGHTWGPDDVYGLAKNPRTGKYVVEGYYVENVSRAARSATLNSKSPMGSIFDRKSHSSGLMVWHFDYWRQSTTYFGHGNDAQSDSNRYQVDVEEFDQNDNTQELQLNHSRGNPSDYLVGAATGITSGTRLVPPGTKTSTGKAQDPVELSGTSTPVVPGEAQFEVKQGFNNASMTVSVTSDLVGDCKLQLVDPSGKAGTEVDAGSFGGEETLTVATPAVGTWTAKVADFAACGPWSGRVIFAGSGGAFSTKGAADTWSNWSQKPTGWAFTSVSGTGNGLEFDNEGGTKQDITLDVLDLRRAKDVSPGFVTGRQTSLGSAAPIVARTPGVLQVPVFSNGGVKPGSVTVEVREGSAKGRLVAREAVTLGAYQRKVVTFRYTPRAEGPLKLVTTVDPRRRVAEGSERNQTQVTNLWVGQAKARVLVVDDDQQLGNERAISGGLSALGIPYAITGAHPSADLMRRYQAVVWSSALDRGQGQLSAYDRAQLRSYLRRGGRLLLTSNRIFDAMGAGQSDSTPQNSDENVQFMAQYLGARIPQGNSTYVVTQGKSSVVTTRGALGRRTVKIQSSPGRPFVTLAGLAQAGAGSLGTTIAPYGTATGVATLDKGSMAAVQPAADPAYIGTAVTGAKSHGSFKTVTLGWNLGVDTDAARTKAILSTVMRSFGVKATKIARTSTPLIYSTGVRDQVSGTATQVTAVVTGKRVGAVLLHYRRHGLGAFYTVRMKRTSSGAYTATIPGGAFTPEGTDYYLTSGRASAPYGGASGSRLTYFVAGSLPKISKPIAIKR